MKNVNSISLVIFSFLFLLFYSCDSSNKNTNSTNATLTTDTLTTNEVVSEPLEREEEFISTIIEYAEDIEANLASSYSHEKKRFVDDSKPANYFQIDFDTYSDADGNLVKFHVSGGEEGFLSATHYYFEGGELFLEETKDSYMDNLYNHQRIFYEHGEILKVEQKTKPEDDETTNLVAAKFSASADYTSKEAEFAAKHKKTYEKYMDYLEKSEVVK